MALICLSSSRARRRSRSTFTFSRISSGPIWHKLRDPDLENGLLCSKHIQNKCPHFRLQASPFCLFAVSFSRPDSFAICCRFSNLFEGFSILGSGSFVIAMSSHEPRSHIANVGSGRTRRVRHLRNSLQIRASSIGSRVEGCPPNPSQTLSRRRGETLMPLR